MGHHKWTDASQGNTMGQYTTPVVLPQCAARLELNGDAAGTPLNTEEPLRAELLAAIQGSWVVLEGKIEPVVVEVNLLQADLRKVSNKVKVAEGYIAELQSEVGMLQKQMVQATSAVGRLEARLEDAEGRSRRNHVRLLGFPERAEGSATESFFENWIRDVLQPTGLSRVFVVEHALVAPPWPGAPPRAINARLLNYKDRDCVLRAAQEVWRWLEMWDKVAPGRTEGSGGMARRLPERKAQTGDHMALGSWRNRVTEWRYSEMEQWRVGMLE
ncbi:hypothetical protein NDU88_002853 [Pleurodeles waltl]|uniref:Uncharacterized protein n=1 Tax=Pleurodeles waltl TaxID=8319 RepID=A0AAV7UE78_PLEWA|nr:hypothetical protein NDU88_002853 [Pleurodeles waltl]